MTTRDWASMEEGLVEAGYHRLEIEDCPEQLHWWYRPLTWRERMPMVRGYQRSVVIVDLPIRNPERVDALFEEVGSLAASGLPKAAGSALTKGMPIYAYPLYALTFVVALAAAYFLGISLELDDHAWCVIVFDDTELSEAARAQALRAGGAAPAFIALSATWRGDGRRIVVPDRPQSVWGQYADIAKAAMRDIRRELRLRGHAEVTRARSTE